MAAKHFRTDAPIERSDDEDISIYRPLHDAGQREPQGQARGENDTQPASQPLGTPNPQAQPESWNESWSATGAPTPGASGGQGGGWYYGPGPSRQAWQPEGVKEPQPERQPPKPHHRKALAVGICAGAVCVAAIAAGLALRAPIGRVESDANNGATAQSVATSDSANAEASSSANDASQTDASQADTSAQTLAAGDLVSRLSSLSHDGSDCSLPTDGVEVDVKDGRVLVAYQSADDAQGTLSRMTASAVALAQQLSGAELSDSSTAQDGVSTVPTTTGPAAIAAGEAGTPFAGVEVVALGEGRYVIGALSLATADGLDAASEAQILSAASSYAIEGPAYRYSGLASSGVAQSKGDAPTLLTGEQIVMRMTVPQPTQAQSSSSNANASGGSSAGTGRSTSSSGSSSTSTSTSTSRNVTAGTSQRGSSASSGSASTGTSSRRNTTYSGGTGSGYATGGGSAGSGSGGTGGYGSSTSSTGYGTSGSAASGSASSSQDGALE